MNTTRTRVAPRVYVVCVLKVIDSFAYFATALNVVLFVSDAPFSFDDRRASWLYGVWGVAIGVCGGALGWLVDAVGVRRALVLGGLLSFAGRALLARATQPWHVYVALCAVQPAGMVLADPVMTIVVRRSTPIAHQSVTFAVFYACMNIGALLAGLATNRLAPHYASIVDASALAALVYFVGACALAVFGVDDDDTAHAHTTAGQRGTRRLGAQCARRVRRRSDSGRWARVNAVWVDDDNGDDHANDGVCSPCTTAIDCVTSTECAQSCTTIARDRVFWSALGVMVALLGAGTVFRHVDITLPKWLLRTLGPTASYGLVYAINPVLVIVGAPLAQHALRRRDVYTCLVVGTAFVALAPLALAALPPSYASAALFMVVLGVGECVYAPRALEYFMSLCPHGREGVYGAMASLPVYFIKVLSGAFSGDLLATYCPDNDNDATATELPDPRAGAVDDDARQCTLVWALVAVPALTSPVLLLLGRRWLYANDAVRARRLLA